MRTESEITDKSRLLFGAGFVFGVTFTMLILAVVASTVAGQNGTVFLGSGLVVTIAAGLVFASIVGVSLYFLAFPENRIDVPLDWLGSSADSAAEESD